ncbi:MAG TPA: MFS transporter [Symbiobacteriaceae bacterium]|jgi:MFS family permease|nr:MFS transporter [Symbiobacteriaceae bacterium]
MEVAAAELKQAETAGRAGLWRNRTFVSLLIGQAVSVVGDGFHSVALGLWVLQTTGSAAAMATIMSVRVIATILLGSFAGAVVDRVDRRRLMIGMDVVRFALVVLIALLMARGQTSLLPVVVITGLMAVCGNFFGPAFQASMVNIVRKDEVQKATGLLQVVNTLGQVVGPFIGGTVVAAWGGWMALSVDAASFLIAAVMIWLGGRFASPKREAGAHSSLWSDMREGFRYIRSNPLALSVVSVAPALNFFGNAAGLLTPVIAVRVWHANATQFGSLEAIFPLGFAVGAAAVMALSSKMRRRGWWMIGSILLTGVGITLVPLAPSVAVALPYMFFTGLANAVCNVMLPVILQTEVPADMQGRVFGTLMSLVSIASPVAMLVSGVLADRFDPVMLGALAGALMLLTGVVVTFVSSPMRAYN